MGWWTISSLYSKHHPCRLCYCTSLHAPSIVLFLLFRILNSWTGVRSCWGSRKREEKSSKGTPLPLFAPLIQPCGTRKSSDLSLSVGRGPPCTQTHPCRPPRTHTTHTWFSFVGSEVRRRWIIIIGRTWGGRRAGMTDNQQKHAQWISQQLF